MQKEHVMRMIIISGFFALALSACSSAGQVPVILPPAEDILGAPALPTLPDPDKATRKDFVDLLYEYEAVAQACRQK